MNDETLLARGVELTEEPTQRPYGIDFGLRDPFGNQIRIGQLTPKPRIRHTGDAGELCRRP